MTQLERLFGGCVTDAHEEEYKASAARCVQLRFRNRSGECFSKQEKTDIGVVADEHSYFYAEQ